MDGFIKQSTAVTIKIGPFLDDTDGKTPETALTISQSDVRLSKNGGSFAQKNDSSSCSHDENGYYTCSLNATDTNTLGILKVGVLESGALPVWHTFQVVHANTFDALFGSGYLPTNMVQINGASVSTTTAQIGVNVVNFGGTAVTGRDIGASVLLSSGTGTGQILLSSGAVTVGTNNDKSNYGLADGAITSAKFSANAITSTVVADNTITASKINTGAITNAKFASGAIDATAIADNAITAAKIATDAITADKIATDAIGASEIASSAVVEIAGAVWDEARSGHTTAGTFGQGVASVQGNVTGSVNSVVSGVTVTTNNDKTGYFLSSSQTFNLTGNITGNLSGSVGSVTSGVTVTTNNDKTGYSLSSSGIDAIWDATGTLGLSFEVLLQRAYQMINNKMRVNESTGAVALRNIGDTGDIATGSVTSSSGYTTRTELSWT